MNQSQQNQQFYTTPRARSVELPKGFFGMTWDAKHLDNILRESNYSSLRGKTRSIILPNKHHKKIYSTGEHFFRTTKDNKNESKIGYTPILPLVSNPPIDTNRSINIAEFFNAQSKIPEGARVVNGKSIKLRCEESNQFKFEGNAIKYQFTDPLTLKHQQHSSDHISGYQKQRMKRLITKRHPHGMTGIDHPLNPQTNFYQRYQQKNRVRQQPNSHRSFIIDRDWNNKKRSVPPVDTWKHRQTITVRKFRNEDTHGYNIITNRKIQNQ